MCSGLGPAQGSLRSPAPGPEKQEQDSKGWATALGSPSAEAARLGRPNSQRAQRRDCCQTRKRSQWQRTCASPPGAALSQGWWEGSRAADQLTSGKRAKLTWALSWIPSSTTEELGYSRTCDREGHSGFCYIKLGLHYNPYLSQQGSLRKAPRFSPTWAAKVHEYTILPKEQWGETLEDAQVMSPCWS